MKKKIANCSYLGELPRWFLTAAPDFLKPISVHDVLSSPIDFAAHEAPVQKLAMPHNANSQCYKLLAWLADGNVLTSLKAIELLGATEAPRRIRQVRRTLQVNGLGLLDKVINRNGKRFKEYHIPEWDLQETKRLLGK
jgi:hypothetical protein